jgi:hypothetical protein
MRACDRRDKGGQETKCRSARYQRWAQGNELITEQQLTESKDQVVVADTTEMLIVVVRMRARTRAISMW